jgi:predicted CoA-binding protein
MDQLFFSSIKTIAIVGLSDKPGRPSYSVARYLQEKGFTIIPINPSFTAWNGLLSYSSLDAVPSEIHIDVVDIFRKSEFVPPIVQSAIRRGDIKTVWMQEGVENSEAESIAKKAGLTVVSNMCMMKKHQALT